MKYLILISILPFSAIAESWVCNFDRYSGFLANPERDLIKYERQYNKNTKKHYYADDFDGMLYEVTFENDEAITMIAGGHLVPYSSTLVIDKNTKKGQQAFVSTYNILTKRGTCTEVK
jgi:hypothetical protein